MKQSEMIAWAEQKRKNRKRKSAKKKESAQVSLINKKETTVPKKPAMEVMTMVRGKPSLSTDFVYDRTLFDQKNTPREAETSKQWSISRKQQEQLQKPPPKMIDKYDSVTGGYVKKPSTEKRFAIDPTTEKSLKDVRTEGDHIASLFTVQQMVTPPSKLSTDFVKNKWKVREGGTENLSPKQMQELYLTDYIQITSEKVNQAKGAKRIADYRKEGGWGAEGTVSKKIAVKQARGYHDSLLAVAKEFGKRGGFSREDRQAYMEIIGEEPHPLLDADNPEFSPPSTSPNITGFDTYGDKRRQKAADKHFGKEKAKEAKQIQHEQAVAEYSGPPQQEAERVKAAKYEGKSAKEVALEKKQAEATQKAKARGYEKVEGKWQKIIKTLPATDQSAPKSLVTAQFTMQKPQAYSGKTIQQQKDYDVSPEGRGYEKVNGKWQKKSKVKKKKTYLEEMFPGINAPKLVKNKKGVLVTPRIKNMKYKTKAQRFRDSERWM